MPNIELRYDGDEYTDFNISNGYYDLSVPYDIISSKYYFLLWVKYTTGDSFNTYHNQKTPVFLFEDYDDAKTCLHVIERFYNLIKDKNFRLLNPNVELNNYSFQIPLSTWTGYFEHIDEINITEVKETGDKRNVYKVFVGT